jgi:hypothetical protein
VFAEVAGRSERLIRRAFLELFQKHLRISLSPAILYRVQTTLQKKRT